MKQLQRRQEESKKPAATASSLSRFGESRQSIQQALTGQLVQRKCTECEEEEQVQRKETIGAANDPLESEADRVADSMVSRLSGRGSYVASGDGVGPISAAANRSSINRKANGASSTTQSGSLKPSGLGSPLPKNLGQSMSGMLGYDLSSVRVHTDEKSGQAAKSINAKAYTMGNDIVFGKGQYQPDTPSGLHLLGHEVAHVVQQSGGDVVRRSPDDEARISGIDYDDARTKNQHYWDRYKLSEVGVTNGLNPYDNPVAYANYVYRFQKVLRAKGYDKSLIKEPLRRDGILGQKTMLCLGMLYKFYENNPEYDEELSNAGIDLAMLEHIASLEGGEFENAIDAAVADIIELDFLAEWNQQINSELVFEHFTWYESSFKTALPESVLNSTEGLENLTTDDYVAIYTELFGGKQLECHMAFFEGDRDFVHRNDATDFGKEHSPAGASRYFYEIAVNPLFYQQIIKNLPLTIPEDDSAKLIHQKLMTEKDGIGAKSETSEPHISGLALACYLPDLTDEEYNGAILRAMYRNMVTDIAYEEAAADWVSDFRQGVDERLAGTPDITDYATLLGVMAGSGGAPISDPSKVEALLQKASTTLGLVIKLEGQDEPFFLTYDAIQKARLQAERNGRNPLKFGTFPAPPGSHFKIDSFRFTARPNSEGGAEVGFSASELLCDSGDGGSCAPWSDWDNFRTANYGPMEPVLVEISELNPNTTFWVQRWRELNGTNQWKNRTYWMFGSSLIDTSGQLWDYADSQNTIAWIDAVVSIFAAATIVAGPLIAVEGGLATGAIAAGSSQVGIQLTKSFVKNAFWFAISEVAAQSLLDFDAKINDPDNGYTDSEKEAWKDFKIALLVLGGTVLLRAAYKGLTARLSTGLRAELRVLESEIAQAGAEVATGATRAEGLAVAESTIRSNADEMVETMMHNEAQTTGLGWKGNVAPAPSGPVSAELKEFYLKQLESKWFRLKMNMYTKLTGKVLDWESLVAAMETAEYREYATMRQALRSGGFAGVKEIPEEAISVMVLDDMAKGAVVEGTVVLGLGKVIRRIPVIGNSAAQHEITHVIQELTTGALTAETRGQLSNAQIIGLELSANSFGGPAAFITFAGGTTVVITGGTFYIMKKIMED